MGFSDKSSGTVKNSTHIIARLIFPGIFQAQNATLNKAILMLQIPPKTEQSFMPNPSALFKNFESDQKYLNMVKKCLTCSKIFDMFENFLTCPKNFETVQKI